MTLDENVAWKNDIEAISKKASSGIEALKWAG